MGQVSWAWRCVKVESWGWLDAHTLTRLGPTSQGWTCGTFTTIGRAEAGLLLFWCARQLPVALTLRGRGAKTWSSKVHATKCCTPACAMHLSLSLCMQAKGNG